MCLFHSSINDITTYDLKIFSNHYLNIKYILTLRILFCVGGWLPSWASPGYRNCMVGTFADVVIADAIVKEVKNFDLALAVEALKKDAFIQPPSYSGGAAGKDGLESYKQLGFIPQENGGESVSRTLDFGFADYSTAQSFKKLASHPDFQTQAKDLISDAATLERRAERAVESMFDKSSGFMVPKRSQGIKSPNFNPITWGEGFTEGSSWHHSFPPYLIQHLAKLHGGKDKLIRKLKEMLSTTSSFHPGYLIYLHIFLFIQFHLISFSFICSCSLFYINY